MGEDVDGQSEDVHGKSGDMTVDGTGVAQGDASPFCPIENRESKIKHPSTVIDNSLHRSGGCRLERWMGGALRPWLVGGTGILLVRIVMGVAELAARTKA